MDNYTPPIEDLRFVLRELIDLNTICSLPGYREATLDVIESILEEAGKLATGVLAPLNRIGDLQGSRLENEAVRTPDGWKEAYQRFMEGGWTSLLFEAEYGGQGLPRVVGIAVQEMWDAANMAFGLCPMLTQTAAQAISYKGSKQQKEVYLRRLVSGEWAGTMNLTESQAGSDLSAVRTLAVPTDDESYLLTGQKIFITYGDHDLTPNIIHLVLARTPGAPAGVKGISLFIVPKFICGTKGKFDLRNDIRTVSLEHKLGIHASPTAVLSYGDEGGAVGYLVGEECHGLEYMFIMMNIARHAVGVEGYAIAERAYQRALTYAQGRIQGRAVGSDSVNRVSIIHHPDVRRVLMVMKCRIEAMRALSLYAAAATDVSERTSDPRERSCKQRMVDILIPLVKGWSSEVGNDIAGRALQVMGGMGFIEESGAAQDYRDVRITTIYEGTSGIQAADLVGRKLLTDGGSMVREIIATIYSDLQIVVNEKQDGVGVICRAMSEAVSRLEEATDWILTSADEDLQMPFAASFYYLMLWGTVAGGWQMARAAGAAGRRLAAGDRNYEFLQGKLLSARCYALHVLPESVALHSAIVSGSELVVEAEDVFT